jgi:hypothetical protein
VPPGPLAGPFPPARGPGLDRSAVEEAAQVVGQGRGAGVAPGQLFLQALQADCFQVARDLRLQAPRRYRICFEHLLDRVDPVRALEGRPARQRLVEDGAQRIHVGGRTLREALEGQELTNLLEAERILARLVRWYNEERLHSALGYLPPGVVYRGHPEERKAERRRKLAQARHRRQERNLGLQQGTLPFKAREAAL